MPSLCHTRNRLFGAISIWTVSLSEPMPVGGDTSALERYTAWGSLPDEVELGLQLRDIPTICRVAVGIESSGSSRPRRRRTRPASHRRGSLR
jgi:hypothetical protein